MVQLVDLFVKVIGKVMYSINSSFVSSSSSVCIGVNGRVWGFGSSYLTFIFNSYNLYRVVRKFGITPCSDILHCTYADMITANSIVSMSECRF